MPDASPATPQDSTPPATCECIELTNNALDDHNTELGVDFRIDRETGQCNASIALVTQVIEKKRGARPKRMLANYCPLCGVRYTPKNEATR